VNASYPPGAKSNRTPLAAAAVAAAHRPGFGGRCVGQPGAVVSTRHQYDHLASLYLPIGLGVFALVVVAFLACLWRYRAGARPAASQRSEARLAEGAWIAVVAAVVGVLLIATLRVESRVDARSATPALAVEVTAAKWDWRFAYAGGTALQGEVVVPAGRTVRFAARSVDVLHDFWIPDVRFQRQVWPQHVERFDLVFPHAGTYQGLCAWFCGLHHQNMHFTVRALAPDAYAAWAAEHAAR
jgi:cytochrome c oxidase subunit 2